jgi:hypothetical protein
MTKVVNPMINMATRRTRAFLLSCSAEESHQEDHVDGDAAGDDKIEAACSAEEPHHEDHEEGDDAGDDKIEAETPIITRLLQTQIRALD